MLKSAEPRRKGVVLVSIGVIIVSFDSLLVRLQALAPFQVIFWRGLISAVGFAILAVVEYREHLLVVTRSHILAVVGAAGCFAISNGMFVLSVTHTAVSHTLVILATTPIMAAVLARLLLGERSPIQTWIAGVVVAVGVIGIFVASPGPGQVGGDLAALIASLAFALLLIVLRRVPDTPQAVALSAGGLITAAAAVPAVGQYTLDVNQASYVLLNGLVVLPVGMALIARGPRYLRVSEVSLLMLLETILGPLWVWAVLREAPSWQTVLSGLLIVGALLVHSVYNLRSEH